MGTVERKTLIGTERIPVESMGSIEELCERVLGDSPDHVGDDITLFHTPVGGMVSYTRYVDVSDDDFDDLAEHLLRRGGVTVSRDGVTSARL